MCYRYPPKKKNTIIDNRFKKKHGFQNTTRIFYHGFRPPSSASPAALHVLPLSRPRLSRCTSFAPGQNDGKVQLDLHLGLGWGC